MPKFCVYFLVVGLGVSTPLAAQVYQSTGEDGSVTFSDQPTTGSQQIVVPETNVGDSVDVPPPTPASAEPAKPAVVAKEPQNQVIEVENDSSGSNHRRNRYPNRPVHRRR